MTEAQPAARPKPSRSQPEFAKKLRYLQQSDPVDAKELFRRLEICYAEQEQNIERTLRPVRSSSDTSLDGSGPSTPKKKARPFTFHPDTLARSLDFQQREESGNKPIIVETVRKSKRKSAPLLSQGSIKLDKSELLSGENASRHSEILPTQPPGARSLKALDEEIALRIGQDAAEERQTSNKERSNVISSAPGYFSKDAKSDTARHDESQVAAPPVSRVNSGTSPVPSSLPLSFRIPLPTAGESLMDSIQGAQSDPSTNADKVSLDSASTITKRRHSVSSSGYPSTTPSSQPPSSPPKPVVQQAEKRKSWNMRSLVASRKGKTDGSERGIPSRTNSAVQGNELASARRQSGNGVISPHAEVARAAASSVSAKAEQRKSAVQDKGVPSRLTPDLLATGISPIPLLILPGDQKRSTSAQQVVRDYETVKKEHVWKRFSLRKTLTEEHELSKADKAALKSLPMTEDLRSKQLAMRQRAISDAKRPKEEKTGVVVSQESNQPKADLLELQLQELQEQQVRERQRKQELIEENRQRQMDEERRQQEIAEAKRRHILIEEKRKQQLAEGMRLQEQRMNELQAQRKAELQKQKEEAEAKEKAERELAEAQERQKAAKEKELQELQAQLKALEEEDRQNKAQPQPQAARSKVHSRGPSAASMKPWAPPPRVSSSRTSLSRTPFTPPQVSRKPSLSGHTEASTERANSPRYSLIPTSPTTRAEGYSQSRKNSIAELAMDIRPSLSKGESRKNSATEMPKGLSRPPSPFSCPRPPPRIDSLPKKDKPVINHSRPTSRGNIHSRPISRGREEMIPRKVTYSNNERPISQPLRSRTPSLRRQMPLIGEDGHTTLQRSRSSSTARRPKSRSGTPSIPADVPEFDPTGMTPESKHLLALQRDQLLHHKAKSSSNTPTLSQFSTPPPFRRISRFYSTPPPQTAPHRKPELGNVERIPGMTPESVIFLRQQEKLAAERFGWDQNTFTVAPSVKRNMTEETGVRLSTDRERERRYKKQNWWKVWRLL